MCLHKLLLVSLLGLGSRTVSMGQSCYTGTIGNLQIELTLENGGAIQAVQQQGLYVYTKFDTPIKLTGTLKQGNLTLTERDSHGKAFGTLCHYDMNRCQERTTDLPLLEAAASLLYQALRPTNAK